MFDFFRFQKKIFLQTSATAKRPLSLVATFIFINFFEALLKILIDDNLQRKWYFFAPGNCLLLLKVEIIE